MQVKYAFLQVFLSGSSQAGRERDSSIRGSIKSARINRNAIAAAVLAGYRVHRIRGFSAAVSRLLLQFVPDEAGDYQDHCAGEAQSDAFLPVSFLYFCTSFTSSGRRKSPKPWLIADAYYDTVLFDCTAHWHETTVHEV